MSQVIGIFRAAMAQRAADAVDASYLAAMAEDRPLFDSTPTGLDQAGEEGYYVEPASDAPQVPEEC